MSLDKAIKSGKEHRKKRYHRCLNYCDICLMNDLHNSFKKGLVTLNGKRKKYKWKKDEEIEERL